MAFFAIVGTDVHRLPLDELERVAGAGKDPVAFARRARDLLAESECAALVTCNRVELMVASERTLEPASLGEAFHAALGRPGCAAPLFVHVGEEGLRHLLRVACSLESAALGEEQILGQVRESIRAAREAGLAGRRLASAFDLALRIGKKVRRESGLADLGTDLARLSLRHLKTELRASGGPLVLLGTGAMARSILAARPKDAREGWLVVGRERSRAAALAAEFQCDSTTLSDFLASTAPIRALVAATRAEAPIVAASLVRARLALGAGVVDLGLPRNVDPEARSHARLADLADLHALAEQHRSQLDETVARIDGWIEEAIDRQSRRVVEGASS
jgi:glutamyl-tRNA reductase